MTLQIDSRCKWITVEPCQLPGYRLTKLAYWDANAKPKEGNDSANIYIRAKGKDGLPALGQKAFQFWPDGKAEKQLEIQQSPQVESDPLFPFAGCDFFMTGDSHRPGINDAGPYMITLAPNSDKAIGFGVAPNRAHDVYALYFEWAENETPATILIDVQIATLMVNQKFPDPSTAMAIVLAESGGNPKVTNTSVPGNVDRGLWQISTKYHGPNVQPPTLAVTDAEAFDPILSTQAAFKISKGGTDWHEWTTFKVGAHKPFMARAQAAVALVIQTPDVYVTLEQLEKRLNEFCADFITKSEMRLFLDKWKNDLGN